MNHKTMTYEEWFRTFRPMPNPWCPRGEFQFDTHSAGNFVKEFARKHPHQVWTLYEFGQPFIQLGYHFNNRLAYYLTEVPHDPSIPLNDIPFWDKEDFRAYIQDISEEGGYPDEIEELKADFENYWEEPFDKTGLSSRGASSKVTSQL